MATIPSVTTAAQLALLPADEKKYELVNGELIMMLPAGGQHGRLAARINQLLSNHVYDNKLGATFAAETGFLIATNPDTVRAPDAAFVQANKWNQLEDEVGYLPVAPDLVAEVVSPNDSSSAVEAKAQMWLDAGPQTVLVVDPVTQMVRVYDDRSQIKVLRPDDTFDAGEVVAGWKPEVNNIFS